MTCDLSSDATDESPSDSGGSATGTESQRSHSADSVDTGSDESPDVDEAMAWIRARGETVRDRELETAMGRLEARRDLSAAEREALDQLSRRLVERLLAVPERGLREAADADEIDDAASTALELFG